MRRARRRCWPPSVCWTIRGRRCWTTSRLRLSAATSRPRWRRPMPCRRTTSPPKTISTPRRRIHCPSPVRAPARVGLVLAWPMLAASGQPVQALLLLLPHQPLLLLLLPPVMLQSMLCRKMPAVPRCRRLQSLLLFRSLPRQVLLRRPHPTSTIVLSARLALCPPAPRQPILLHRLLARSSARCCDTPPVPALCGAPHRRQMSPPCLPPRPWLVLLRH